MGWRMERDIFPWLLPQDYLDLSFLERSLLEELVFYGFGEKQVPRSLE